jgi:RNA polymerase sigma-32 factor
MNYQQSPGFDYYMKQATKVKILTRDEEQTLARKYQRGDQRAGQQLVAANLRFVVQVAHKYKHYVHESFEDLVQEGNIGLLRALHKFDPDRGYRFVTYAVWWIRARIMLWVMSNTSIVKFGTTNEERCLFHKVHRLYQREMQLDAYLDQDQVFERIALEVDASVAEISSAFERLFKPDRSLDAPFQLSMDTFDAPHRSVAGLTSFGDFLVDPSSSAHDRLERTQVCRRVRESLTEAARNPRERLLVERRLLAHDPMTFEELGAKFGCSRERVRQIEVQILNRFARAQALSA